MARLSSRLKEAVIGLAGPLAPALTAAGSRRGRGLVLCYHRVGDDAAPWEIVPSLPTELFREQVAALQAIGDVVPLTNVLLGSGDRPRFAITFDDDYQCHLRTSAPILVELGAPATYFVSGRTLSGLGPYWWQRLERRIADEGLDHVAESFGVSAHSPANLAAQLSGTPAVDSIRATHSGPTDLLDADGINELARSGFDIGFHTARHDLLTTLAADRIDDSMSFGRQAVEDLIGRPLRQIAYPHGQCNDAVTKVAATHFESGWTGSGLAVSTATDRWRRGRWEPGELDGERMRREVAVRLNRPTA